MRALTIGLTAALSLILGSTVSEARPMRQGQPGGWTCRAYPQSQNPAMVQQRQQLRLRDGSCGQAYCPNGFNQGGAFRNQNCPLGQSGPRGQGQGMGRGPRWAR